MASFTSNSDTWLGSSLGDSIDALAGDDVLDGDFGNDSLLGNVGNDLIAGGAGSDTLYGGDGIDVLDGGIDNDLVFGEAGDDLVYGGTGLDTLYGGLGNDYLSGGDGNDSLFGGAGSDALDGGAGNDILSDSENIGSFGGISTESDEMIGGLGNDTLLGGYDVMWGNDGNDVFNVNNQGTVYGGVGNDIITVNNSSSALGSWLEGGLGSDSITAGSGNDTLFSGYGKDTLSGGDGNDSYVMTFDDFYDSGTGTTLAPNIGADTITDSSGVDTVYYIRDFSKDGRDDDVDAAGKELDPTTPNTLDYYVTLPNGIENAVLDDQIFVNNPNALVYFIASVTGNALNNAIKGSTLYDVLDGGAGNDTINAGDGNDTIFAGNGVDVINGGSGFDMVAAQVSFNLTTDCTDCEAIDLLDYPTALSATGTNQDNLLMGNKFDNSLIGGGGNDTLDGWFYSPTYALVVDSLKATGNDTLVGGTGNDLYRIDSTQDTIVESASTGGIDTVEFKGAIATDTYVLPSGVENLKMLGNLKEGDGNNLNNQITGDASANILKGGYGDDFLDGGSGIDNFEGGYGDDTLVVDSTNEIIKEIAGQGNDWVQSASINLDLNTPNWGGSIENGRLTGTSFAGNVTGSNGDNYLVGNDAGNVLDGRDGKDTLEGGLGADIYYIDSLTDTLKEVPNGFDTAGKILPASIDTVQSSINFSLTYPLPKPIDLPVSPLYTLPTLSAPSVFTTLVNFENLSLSAGTSALSAMGNLNDNIIKGNDLNNTLFGLDGNDILDGSAGVDTLVGGKGNDTYRLSNDGDVIVERSGVPQGIDTIEIQNTFSLSLSSLDNNVENLSLVGTIAADGEGSSGSNTIIGNSAVNKLSGLDGNDTLKGGEGADTLIGGTGADTLDLTESLASRDVVRFDIGDSTASASEADKVIKFAMSYDSIDLPLIQIAINTSSGIDGTDSGSIKSHSISNGIIKFDDVDGYVSPVSISSTTNLNSVIDYLKTNITDGSTVAFQVSSEMWLFQDNGDTDTLVDLVGVSATSLSTGFSSSAITIIQPAKL